MSVHVQNVVLVDRLFDDFDELAAQAKYWHLDFQQIDRGPFQGKLYQALFGTMQIGEARFARRLRQAGWTPPGMRTFVVPAGHAVSFNWRKLAVGPNDLLVFPQNGELQSISDTNFHIFTISFEEPEVEDAAESLGIRRWSSRLQCEKVTSERIVPALRRALRMMVRRWATLSYTETTALRAKVARLLIRALDEGTISDIPSGTRLQDQAICGAESLIARYEREPLSLADLCEATRVSERTLRNAFQRYFGLSPKAYLIARRLNGVRRDLKRAAVTGASINEVAASWGFWHMGQFAADYRCHFGELPSETLRRCAR